MGTCGIQDFVSFLQIPETVPQKYHIWILLTLVFCLSKVWIYCKDKE